MFLYRRNKIWWLGWSDNGKKRARALHRVVNLPLPIRDRTVANKVVAAIQQREVNKLIGLPPKAPDIDIFYGDYFAFCQRLKTPNTLRADSYRFKRWLSFLQERRISTIGQISKSLLSDFIQERLSNKSNSTVNTYVAVIRASLQWAVRQGYLRDNPLKDVPKLSVERPARSASFREGELGKLFSLPDPLFVAYLKIVYYTLMRRSEALNLTWSDIDLVNRTIQIRRTKTKRPRTIPIAAHLAQILANLPRREDNLFPGWKEHSITQKFRRLRQKMGLQIDGIHHFRHLCASELLRRGANPRAVQELLGHKTMKTTMEIYAHVSVEGMREAVEKL